MSLFVRTFSQALQAFMPIALSLTWFERTGRNRVASAIRGGLLISIPATMVASWLFHRTSHAALDEAVLAAMTVAATGLFARRVHLAGWIVTTLAALVVVRQTMEIGSALETAALEVRLFDPTAAIAAGLVVGAGVAWAMRRLSIWLARHELVSATRAFTLMFFVQAAIYTFHELAEARLLPASDLLHAATEAYGPDGIYGVHLSDLLVVAPLVAAAMTFARSRKKFGRRVQFAAPRHLRVRWLGAACLVCIGLQGAESSPHVYNSTADQAAIIAIVRQPHLLFRDMTRTAAAGTVARAGTLSVASLGAPDGPRASTELSCERVSFAGGHGLCLHTEPGIFPRYTAAVLDGSLHPFASIKLEGRPSRTRTSADGRIGAITVFVFGENYAAPFSTRTTLVDMSSGDVIGELEQFSTWRDGMRWRAVDFNFWGVTFASDPNTFYATLRTGGSTYLVRGDLGLRRLTVLRDNVECPSISPDNRRLAFKKRVGPGLSDWRLAVLDLKTMTDRLIAAETRRIDDQVEWLDATHVLYSVPGGTTSLADVWVAPIDGDTPARVFLPGAESPIVVR